MTRQQCHGHTSECCICNEDMPTTVIEDPPPVEEPTDDSSCGNDLEQEAVELANEQRARYGLAPVTCNAKLNKVVHEYSQLMCDEDDFGHFVGGTRPSSRLNDGGISWRGFAENAAEGQRTPEDVIRTWIFSRDHRENMLQASATEIGVGYVECAGNPYWTMMLIW